MVTKQLPDNIITTAKRFRSFLEEGGVSVDSMIVFGSQAKGSPRPDSDIDICVVSESFGKDDVVEMQELFKKARKIDTKIEPYPLHPLALRMIDNPIVGEIVKWGVVV